MHGISTRKRELSTENLTYKQIIHKISAS